MSAQPKIADQGKRSRGQASWDLEYAPALWRFMNQVDMAHVLELSRTGLAPKADLQKLMRSLFDLEKIEPGQFNFDISIGDVYKNRFAFLEKATGPAAGWLGFGRARREVSTVAFHICVKSKLLILLANHLELAEQLGRLAMDHLETPMPDYTYFQPAQPSTLGHYLLGYVEAMSRDWSRLLECYERNDAYPGAIGSTNGTRVGLDRDILAKSLGFARPTGHSRDGIWRVDLVFETISTSAALALTLARLADDFHVWSTREFGFCKPAPLGQRSSVAMPQKKNPYAFSMARGALNRAIGQVSSVALLSRTASNQVDNRIIVYTDVPCSLDDLADAISLLAVSFDGMTFNKKRLQEATQNAGLEAMDLAEIISLKTGLNYSASHCLVTKRLAQNLATAALCKQLAKDVLKTTGTEISSHELETLTSYKAMIQARSSPGSASPASCRTIWSTLYSSLSNYAKEAKRRSAHALKTEQELRRRAEMMISAPTVKAKDRSWR